MVVSGLSRRSLLLAALLAAGLSGCAGMPADWGRGEVAALAGVRGHTLPQN